MLGMRYQPQGASRIRSDLLGKVVGANFTNNRLDIGGSNAEVVLYANPVQTVAPKHGLARKFVTADLNYATIAPAPGIVDFAQPYAIVCAFVVDSVAATTRILSYRHAANLTGIQFGFSASGRFGFWQGSSTGEAARASSNAAVVVAKPYVAVMGWDGTAYFLYIDGVKQSGSSASAFVTSNTGTNTDINIGRRNTGSSYMEGQVSLFAHIQGQVDAMSLSLNPWQLFEDSSDEDEFAAAAAVTPIVLEGAAGVQLSASGTLSTAIRLAGTAQVRATATGELSTGIRLAGAAALQMSSTGSLAGAGAALSGAASLTVAAAGALSTSIALAGAASVRVSGSGALASTAAVLAGAVALRMTTGGALSTAIALAGAAAARMSSAGMLGSVEVPVDVVDISTISAARIVVFEGSGRRVVPFEASGGRVVPFAGSGHRVTQFDSSGSRVTPFAGSGSRTVRFE